MDEILHQWFAPLFIGLNAFHMVQDIVRPAFHRIQECPMLTGMMHKIRHQEFDGEIAHLLWRDARSLLWETITHLESGIILRQHIPKWGKSEIPMRAALLLSPFSVSTVGPISVTMFVSQK